mgnify:CR=1 FL=1
MSKTFDVVVIGGGPGGYIAAIRAAQLGFQVACIDEWKNDKGGPAPGGTCTNVGCIPSKALLQSSEHFDHATHHFADHGISVSDVKMDVAKMIARKDTVVKQNNDGILYLFKKNKVTFFHGRGSFVKSTEGGWEIAVGEETLVGRQIVVATGSVPIEIPGFAYDQRRILDSTGALALDHVPESMIVIGGGYIGLELGQTFQRVGTKLIVVEGLDRLLPSMEKDLAQLVHKQIEDFLRDMGVQEIEAQGKAFDPNLHEAMSQEPSADVAEGTILRVMRRGYKLKDRLLRAACVVVSSGPPASEPAAE